MKRFLLILLIVFLVAAAGLGFFLATFDADRARPTVIKKMEEVLGRPVALKRIVLRWKGGIAVELHGLEIPPALHVGNVSLLLRPLPLLRGDVQILSVLLQAPTFRVIRHADGVIEIPGVTAELHQRLGTSSAAGTVPPRSSLLIRELLIREGTFIYADQSARPPLEITLEQVQLRASLDLRSQQLDLKDSSAKLGEGTLRLSGSVKNFGSNPEGQVDLKTENIRLLNVNLLREVFDRMTVIPGLTESLLARLPPEFAQKLTEKDTLFRPMDFHLTLENGAVLFQNFRVATDSFELVASGRAGLDGSLAFPAQIFIQQDLSKALIQSADELRLFTDDQWRIVLPVRVGGTVQKPSVSPDLQVVAEKLFSAKAQDLVGELLNKINE
ncbi:MAG: AsmA family protein [Candidatus Omnitrophota bacterium]|nr:AsmA family protein [Candidatus Omnitrophota bacterium]